MKRFIPPKTLRFFLLVFLLPTLLFTLKLLGPGAGLLVSAAACGGSSGATGGDGGVGGDGDGSAFTTDAPIDIPSPIAKGIEGVDPTSLAFTPASETSCEGTISMETIGGVDATIALIRSGEVVARKQTSNGRVEFEITVDMCGEVLAFVVEGAGEFEGSVSPPVLARVEGDAVLQIYVTNTGVIQYEQIAVAIVGTVAFSASDSSGAPLLGITTVRGGIPSVLTDETDNLVGQLAYGGEVLYGIDTSTALIVSLDNQGAITTEEGTPSLSAENRHFSIAPDAAWMANSTGSTTTGILLELVDWNTLVERSVTLDSSVATAMSFDWKTDDQVVAARKLNSGSYEIQLYTGLEALRDDASAVVTIMTAKSSATSMANPSADQENGNRFVYECDDSAGNTDLCLIASDGTDSVLVNRTSGSVAHARFAPDGSYVVYEVLAASDGECEGQLAVYDMDAGTERIIANDGCFPAPYPSDPNVIAYLSPVGGKLQIAIENLLNSEEATEDDDDGDGDDEGDDGETTATATTLSVSGTSSTITAGTCSAFSVQGQDSSGTAANITAGTTLIFSDSGSGTFYTDSTCATPMDTFTYDATFSIPYPFYFKDNASETTTITVASTGLTSGTLAVIVSGGTPSVLALSGTQSISRYACNAFTVTSKDSSGNTVAVSSNTAVALTKSITQGNFYSNLTCTTNASGMTGIVTGASSQTFYFSVDTLVPDSNPFTFTAAATGFTSGTLSITTTD